MKIKNLSKETSLVGIKVTIPNKLEDRYMGIYGNMYIYSYWHKGIWFKRNMKENRIFPLTMNNIKDLLEFQIVKEK